MLEGGAPPGSLRWHALLYAGDEARDALGAVFALEAQLREATAPGQDHTVSHARLSWWAEEILRLEQGSGVHPVSRAFGAAASGRAVDWGPLREALEGARTEISRPVVRDEAELDLYLRRSGGSFQDLAGQLVAAHIPEKLRRAFGRQVGQVVRQAEIARDLRHDAMHDRLFLPAIWLEQEDVAAADLHAGQCPPGLGRCLARLAARARQGWREATADLDSDAAGHLRGAWVLAELHLALLDRLESRGFDGGGERVELPSWRRLMTAWRAARRAGSRGQR